MKVHVPLKNVIINNFIKLRKLFLQIRQLLNSYCCVVEYCCQVNWGKGKNNIFVVFVFEVEKSCLNSPPQFFYLDRFKANWLHFCDKNVSKVFSWLKGKIADPVIFFCPFTILKHVVEGYWHFVQRCDIWLHFIYFLQNRRVSFLRMNDVCFEQFCSETVSQNIKGKGLDFFLMNGFVRKGFHIGHPWVMFWVVFISGSWTFLQLFDSV